jgi:hypothetical protein
MSPGQLPAVGSSHGARSYDRTIVLDANVLLDKNHGVFL